MDECPMVHGIRVLSIYYYICPEWKEINIKWSLRPQRTLHSTHCTRSRSLLIIGSWPSGGPLINTGSLSGNTGSLSGNIGSLLGNTDLQYASQACFVLYTRASHSPSAHGSPLIQGLLVNRMSFRRTVSSSDVPHLDRTSGNKSVTAFRRKRLRATDILTRHEV